MSDKRIETINPATGRVIDAYDIMSTDEIPQQSSECTDCTAKLENPGYF